MILLSLVAGWGPVFLAELVREARPDLDARYVPQAFAMGWIVVSLWCSVLAVAPAIGHGIRPIVLFVMQSVQRHTGGTDGLTAC